MILRAGIALITICIWQRTMLHYHYAQINLTLRSLMKILESLTMMSQWNLDTQRDVQTTCTFSMLLPSFVWNRKVVISWIVTSYNNNTNYNRLLALVGRGDLSHNISNAINSMKLEHYYKMLTSHEVTRTKVASKMQTGQKCLVGNAEQSNRTSWKGMDVF